jgi:UDP-N-acetylglucosamine 2-epimerase (non-hydrolysing)
LKRLAAALCQLITEGFRVAVVTHPNGQWRKLWAAAWHQDPSPDWLSPLPRAQWLDTARRARLVLSDSGAAAEELPYLGVPLLVYRRRSERPEAFLSGHAVPLCPTETAEALATHIRQFLAFEKWPAPWPLQRSSPYGDGLSGQRSARAIERLLTLRAPSIRHVA